MTPSDGLRADVDLLGRAVALQGAYMAVLQRVVVRLAVAVALYGRGDDVERAMRDGAEQLDRERSRLAEAGYGEVLDDLLAKFGRLRDDLRP